MGNREICNLIVRHSKGKAKKVRSTFFFLSLDYVPRQPTETSRAMSHYRAAAEGGGGGERTRLLFTGLHPSVESSHLSSHIAQCPSSSSSSSISVTDVKVVKRRDGTSRCIAFAGFRSSRDAERVLEWSNQTWVSGARGGSRVKVDWAKDVREDGKLFIACARN